jgi:hypothetical protein
MPPSRASGHKKPASLAVDGGDFVYIPDTGNGCIREIDSDGNIFSLPRSRHPDEF